MKRHVLSGLLVLGTAQPGAAMMQCHYYDEMVAEAVMVVQVAPSSIVPPPQGGQGDCTLTGKIVRKFKGKYPVGTVIRTSVPCEAPQTSGPQRPPMVGATMWRSLEALEGAAVIELHLAAEGGPAGYGAGVVLLDAPTETPAWRSVCQ